MLVKFNFTPFKLIWILTLFLYTHYKLPIKTLILKTMLLVSMSNNTSPNLYSYFVSCVASLLKRRILSSLLKSSAIISIDRHIKLFFNIAYEKMIACFCWWSFCFLWIFKFWEGIYKLLCCWAFSGDKYWFL